MIKLNLPLPRVAKWLNKKLPALLRIEQVVKSTYSELQLVGLFAQSAKLNPIAVATSVDYEAYSTYPISWSPIRQNASLSNAKATLGRFHSHRLSSFLSDSIIGQPDG